MNGLKQDHLCPGAFDDEALHVRQLVLFVHVLVER